MVKVGFTGTREGMTARQRAAVRRLLAAYQPAEAHHGDCVGADAEFHQLVREVCSAGRIVIHPPVKDHLRAYCLGDEIRNPRPYLERNREIVDACPVIIATPATAREIQRSGTWSTVRYARRRRRRLHVEPPAGDS